VESFYMLQPTTVASKSRPDEKAYLRRNVYTVVLFHLIFSVPIAKIHFLSGNEVIYISICHIKSDERKLEDHSGGYFE
jgi:hypothetical protein